MKSCPRCAEVKPFEAFYASSTHKSGYASWCKVCESERSKAKFQRRKDAQLSKAQEWRSANKDKFNASIAAWREQNPGKHERLMKDWAQANKDKVNAKWMKRHAGKKNRTPEWLTADDHWAIQEAYDIAQKRKQMFGFDWHVDHIVPLQGKTVSGLHVPWNLQVIPAKLNQQKSNSFN